MVPPSVTVACDGVGRENLVAAVAGWLAVTVYSPLMIRNRPQWSGFSRVIQTVNQLVEQRH
jgi:hypothetical protein